MDPREHQPRPTPVACSWLRCCRCEPVMCSRLFLSETDTMFLLEPYCAKLLLVLFCCSLWWEVVKIQTTELPACTSCVFRSLVPAGMRVVWGCGPWWDIWSRRWTTQGNALCFACDCRVSMCVPQVRCCLWIDVACGKQLLLSMQITHVPYHCLSLIYCECLFRAFHWLTPSFSKWAENTSLIANQRSMMQYCMRWLFIFNLWR